MIRAALLALLLAAAATSVADAPRIESLEKLYQDEASGIRHYEDGNYRRAYELLSEGAIRGLKKSQYLLAFMFLKGQHVDKSVLLGMAWLGVAKETGDPEWVDLYDALYARLSAPQQAMVDAKVTQYVERYGMQVTNVSCANQPVTGSRRYEYRCVKQEGPAHPVYPVELSP